MKVYMYLRNMKLDVQVITDGTITCTTDLKAETTVSYSLEFYVKDSLVSTVPGTLTIHLSGFFSSDDYVIYNCVYLIIIS